MTHGSRPRTGQQPPRRRPSSSSADSRRTPPRPAPPRRRPPRRRPRRPVAQVRGASLFRLRIGLLLIAMVISVFAARLFQLQGVDAQAYIARAEAAGGVVTTLDLPATRGAITDRNGVPLAESVDGLMLVADPTLTRGDASEIATIVARRLSVDYFDVLDRLRRPDTRFQYVARRVPSTIARQVLAELDDERLRGDHDPARPGARLPRQGRGRQPGRVHERRGGRRRGRRADVRHPALRCRRLHHLRGRRRQPAPARRQRAGRPEQRRGPRADDRPRRAVVQPACAAHRRPGVGGLLGVGRGDGHPQRRAAGRRGLPDLRRQRADALARGRPGCARRPGRLRARLGQQGAHRCVLGRRRPGPPAHPDRGTASRCRVRVLPRSRTTSRTAGSVSP